MGLLDQFANLNPQQTQGLLAAAAQMLQQSGPSRTPTSFGQALGGSLMAYQGSMADSQRRNQEEEQARQMAEMRGLQMQDMQGGLDDRTRARQLEQGIAEAARGAYRAPAQMEASLPGGPAGESAEQSQSMQAGFDHDAFIDQVMKIDPMKGLALRQQFAKQAPQVDRVEVAMRDGVPVRVMTFKDGTEKVSAFDPKADMTEMNLGGVTKWVDKNRIAPGQAFQRTQSPDSIASNAVTMRGQNMVDRRAGQERAGGGKPPAGYRWTPIGELEAIPGGPAGKTAVATEGERKAATLLKRLEGSEQQLSAAIAENPGAAKPGLVAQGLRGIGAETLANSTAVSSERQRVEAAQLDMLDAALTLGTGAAYTREQLEGYRKSYFPQIGDTEATIKDKEARKQNVIEAAKIAAGRAAGGASGDWRSAEPAAPSKPQPQRKSVLKGQTMDGYRFKGGDPANQNNWEKI